MCVLLYLLFFFLRIKARTPSPSPPVLPEPAVIKPKTSPRSGIPTFSGPFSINMEKYKPPTKRLARPKVPQPDLSMFRKEEKMKEYTTSK